MLVIVRGAPKLQNLNHAYTVVNIVISSRPGSHLSREYCHLWESGNQDEIRSFAVQVSIHRPHMVGCSSRVLHDTEVLLLDFKLPSSPQGVPLHTVPGNMGFRAR